MRGDSQKRIWICTVKSHLSEFSCVSACGFPPSWQLCPGNRFISGGFWLCFCWSCFAALSAVENIQVEVSFPQQSCCSVQKHPSWEEARWGRRVSVFQEAWSFQWVRRGKRLLHRATEPESRLHIYPQVTLLCIMIVSQKVSQDAVAVL